MNRTLIEEIPYHLPKELEKAVSGADIYDSSCSPEARVYFIDKDGGYFLKKGKSGTLAREAALSNYFHKKGLAPEPLLYLTQDESDWLLTARAEGEDCTHGSYLSEPKRLADTIGGTLRALHETDFSGCPVMSHTSLYLDLAEKNFRTGNYDKSAFPDSFGYHSAQEAYSVLSKNKNALIDEVLLHGDYCLPNIMLDSWRFSAFIDLGCGGVGDRHVDLFWGAWTLKFNLGTDMYRERFLDAYGRDRVCEEKLRIVAAAEVFG